MKIKLFLIIAPLLCASIMCHGQTASEKYAVDTKESVVKWEGSMLLAPQNKHLGYINLLKGELTIEKNQLAGGVVEVDMNTITDESHKSDNNLIDHIKSPDFFDVKKFPISRFVITKVASANDGVNITGNLTIKGITNEVTFPASIEVKADLVNANGKLIIDRTKWDVRYGSGKFFSNLANEAISDEIALDIKIVARKKYPVPNTIVRNMEQDKNGNIWIVSFDGVFRYDGKSFTNVTSDVSSARFFSVLEDRKGSLWFGTIGSGVYRYDGKSFQNFTTKEGLLNNEIGWIYEDKAGNLWFGVNGGVSRYDGKSFRNYMITGDTMIEDRTGKTFPDFTRPPNEVTSIIEDKAGNFWFATRGNTYIYNGKTFTVFTHEGKPFINVRSLIEDKKGNVWLGGNDGLWRYDGKTFTNFTKNFIGYIYEDKNGNIWTSSDVGHGWALSRYDKKSLPDKMPVATEIKSGSSGFFGIMEAVDGSIWVGGMDGVYRYDGKTFIDFKSKENQE
jgi:polyisoprenoid-binding protein YceI